RWPLRFVTLIEVSGSDGRLGSRLALWGSGLVRGSSEMISLSIGSPSLRPLGRMRDLSGRIDRAERAQGASQSNAEPDPPPPARLLGSNRPWLFLHGPAAGRSSDS